MIMRAIILFFSLLSSAAIVAQPITTLAQLQQQLQQQTLIRGNFTQIRRMALFDSPLQSNGLFLLNKEHGLLWQQQHPFAVTLVLTNDKLSQTFAHQSPQIITEQENPMAFYFSHVFLSLFNGDTSRLQQQFSLQFTVLNPSTKTPDSSNWQLQLTPKNSPLNQIFQTITIEGNLFINTLVIQEIRGDQNEIHFINQTTTPNQLSDNEKIQFQF